MNQHLLKRTITISIIFGVLFFVLNYFSGSDSSIGQLILKSILVIVVFGILYFVLFSIVNSPECIVIGLILGIIASYVWEFIAKNKNGGDKS